MDEDHLVALAVPEEVVHRGVRPAERDLDVGVPHERPAPADLVAARVDVVRVHAPMRVRLGNPLLTLDRREVAELLDAAGRLEVVEDRLVSGEALEAHDLLGQQPPVLPEHDVPLPRDVPATLVERHVRPFRSRLHPGSSARRWSPGDGCGAPRTAAPPLSTFAQPTSPGRVRVVLPEAELVALGVLADREPAHARDGHRLAGLAAELGDARVAGVDVVDVEVDARARACRLGPIDRAARVFGEPRHVVLGRAALEGLELPAEEPAPELARLRRVARGNLDVNHLSSHAPLLFVMLGELDASLSHSIRRTTWLRQGRQRGVRSMEPSGDRTRPSGCHPDALPAELRPHGPNVSLGSSSKSRPSPIDANVAGCSCSDGSRRSRRGPSRAMSASNVAVKLRGSTPISKIVRSSAGWPAPPVVERRGPSSTGSITSPSSAPTCTASRRSLVQHRGSGRSVRLRQRLVHSDAESRRCVSDASSATAPF